MADTKLDAWQESVDRVLACANALKYAIKAHDLAAESGQPSQHTDAWTTVEAARKSFATSVSFEGNRFRALLKYMADLGQQVKMPMDDEQAPGPGNVAPTTDAPGVVRLLPNAQKQLEQSSAVEVEDGPPLDDAKEEF